MVGKLVPGWILAFALSIAGPAFAAPADGEWEGTLTHPDLACSPCKVRLTVTNGVPVIRDTATLPIFTINSDGGVFAEAAINSAGTAGRSVCRLAGRVQVQPGTIVASGNCGNYSSQADLTLKRTSAPPPSAATASASTPGNELPAAAPAGAGPQPFRLGAIGFDIKPGTEIGRTFGVSLLLPCHYTPSRVQHRHQADAVPDATISNIEFEGMMRAAGLPVRGLSTPGPTSYIVLAKVIAMDLNYCIGETSSNGNGFGTMTVEWTVVSALTGIGIYDNTVAGVVRLASGDHGRDGMRAMFAVTFRDAVRQLARDRNFRNAISGMTTTKAAPDASDEPALSIKSALRFTGGITNNMKNILPTVVEIKHPHGVGAGFVIDARGYLLTNAHIVGDANSVTVRFNDGQSMEANVLRRDPLHDIALMKVERGGLRPIPIRSGRLTLTEKVFAVGNPSGLSQTVTDGIVSAYRELPENAQEYIQASISIGAGNSGGPLLDANGNVVGVTASGRAGGVRQLNFFLPIDAALERLNVQLGK